MKNFVSVTSTHGKTLADVAAGVMAGVQMFKDAAATNAVGVSDVPLTTPDGPAKSCSLT